MMNGLKKVVSSLPQTSNNTLALNEKLCYIIKHTHMKILIAHEVVWAVVLQLVPA
jgi:hypothetical protein